MSECAACHGTGKVTCSKCDGKTKIKCDRCDGHGHCQRCDSNGEITCRTCDGDGITVSWSTCPVCDHGKVTKTRWINCDECHGTGEYHYRNYDGVLCKERCYKCDGRGQVEDEYKDYCSACGGEYQKKVEKTCRTCHGTGKEKCPRCGGKEHETCSKCDGSGIIGCDTCKETGKVVCGACKGSGSVDVEAMCISLVNVADECQLSIYKDRVNHDMALVIFDAANQGVGVAAYVADHLKGSYRELAGEKDYFDLAVNADNVFARYVYCTDGFGELGEDDLMCFKLWAGKGFVPALEILALQYQGIGHFDDECEGTEEDLQKSLECWKHILEVKNSKGWNKATIMMAERQVKYLPTVIRGDRHAMLDLGRALLEIGDTRDSIKGDPTVFRADNLGEHWLYRVIESRDEKLIRELAKYCWGRGDAESFGRSKGVELYQKLADEGDAISQSIFGEYLRTRDSKEDGRRDDYRRALIYLYRAAGQGDIEAVRRLGHLYRDGDYVETSRAKANELYVLAAKAGDGWSLYEIGKCYLEGNEVKKNIMEAKRLLTLAVDKEVEYARELLKKIDGSVKVKQKGPSGIIVGKSDKSMLPKFVKKDYKRAVAGKPAMEEETRVKRQESRTRNQRIIKCAKILFGLLARFVTAGMAGFLFWWWLEGLNTTVLPSMLEQVKGITGGMSENLKLAMMVSGGTFVATYVLTFILSKISFSFEGVVQVLASLIGCVPAVVLITSGHWGVGGWMALVIVCAISARFEGKAHESWWRWILMAIGLWVAGGFGMNGNWIISSIITAFSMGILLKDEK